MKRPFLLAAAVLCAVCLAVPARALSDDDDSDAVTTRGGDGRGQVAVFGSTHVAAGSTVQGDNVTVFGTATIDGTVTHDAVTVFGDCRVNGHVEHDLVAVLGTLYLGPNARIEHDVVCIGPLHRDPGAIIHGQIVHPPGMAHFHAGPGMGAWWDRGLHRGQVLTFGPHLTWLWLASLICIGLYALVAAMVPGPTVRAGALLAENPATTLLIGLAAVVAVPLVSLLLFVTVVGIPVAIFLIPTALIVPTVFGRAALYSLIGRRLFSATLSPAAAVMAGGAVVILIMMIPVAGVLALLILTFVAWSCGWAGLILRRTAAAPAFAAPPIAPAPAAPGSATFSAPSAAVAAATAPTAAAMTGIPSIPDAPPFEPAGASTPPPPVYGQPAFAPGGAAAAAAPSPVAASLPRAGFWIRAGAMAIDVALVGVLCGVLSSVPLFGFLYRDTSGPGPFLLLCATYAAVLWKVRGATLGAIICHLALVRVDGRPIDWTTAIVRALACFISVFAIGLGFIWVAFDRERQSWHDKIAGTTVVILPRPQSLV